VVEVEEGVADGGAAVPDDDAADRAVLPALRGFEEAAELVAENADLAGRRIVVDVIAVSERLLLVGVGERIRAFLEAEIAEVELVRAGAGDGGERGHGGGGRRG